MKAQIERNKSYDEIEEHRKLKYKEIETYEVTEDKNSRTYTENCKYIDLAESFSRELGKAWIIGRKEGRFKGTSPL